MQKKTQTVHIYLCRFQAASFIFHMGEVVFLLITNQCVLKYLRHWNDHEVQPVPRVSEKGEPVDGKTSGNNFCEWLKRIDTCKGIPFKDKKKKRTKKVRRTSNEDMTAEEKYGGGLTLLAWTTPGDRWMSWICSWSKSYTWWSCWIAWEHS